MRVMVMVKATSESEAGKMPSTVIHGPFAVTGGSR